MYLIGNHLDDLLKRVFEKLLKSKVEIETTRGKTTEINGILLNVVNPRARLSRTEIKGTIFSCLGELLWYLSASNDLEYIKYYLPLYKDFTDDGKTIYGGYGPRLFNMRGEYNQFQNIIKLLRIKPTTRQAVIQLFDASDIVAHHNDIPCTCTLQFMIRSERLLMFTHMRSNDAFKGLPHDIFAFTMLQEVIARTIGIEVGGYKHSVGSLHLYLKDFEKAKKYVEEGWQSDIVMPPMPQGDPKPSIDKLLEMEHEIRVGQEIDLDALNLDNYWKDIIRLLLIFKLSRSKGNIEKYSSIEKQMSSKVYKPYIQTKKIKLIS